MNTIIAIHPYKHEGLWVFDDESVGLRQEPFVSGADTIIDRMVEHVSRAETGFTLLFSARPFPGCQVEFEWRREESGGNWYYCKDVDMEGWLCPALFKYFEHAPPRSTLSSGRRKVRRLPSPPLREISPESIPDRRPAI